MDTVSIRELKQQASALIRAVRETGAQMQVTDHGKIVALLVRATPAANSAAQQGDHEPTQEGSII